MNTSRILFISDLHLCPTRPETTHLFMQFLAHEAINSEALYILGDFFESWIGDDDLNHFSLPIINALKQLTHSGTPCYFIHGNRDFLVSNKMSDMTGIQLLSDPSVIQYANQQYLLSHGDVFCTDDKAHQRFRKIYLSRFNQWLFMKIPKPIRQAVAQRARKYSQQRHHKQTSYRGDINHAVAINAVQDHQCNVLIHGHTHKPVIDTLHAAPHQTTRVTLPAWGQTGGYLEINAENNMQLINLP